MSIAGRAVGEWAHGLMGYWAFFACASVRAGGREGVGVGRKGLRRAADVLSGDSGMSGFPTIEGVCSWCRRARCVSHTRSQSGVIAARGSVWLLEIRAKSPPGQRLAQAPLSK